MTLSSIRIAVRIVFCSFVVVELPAARRLLRHVREQVDRAQVAHGDLVLARVERDLGAQVRAVHGADVLLRRAHVARILERDPRMPGLEQHRQHLPPQLHRGNLLEQLDLAARTRAPRSACTPPRTRGPTCRAGRARRTARTASSRRLRCTRFMNRSGIQFAVFMSCVRRRSSPVFLRSSRNSSMSRCQVSRYVQTAPLRLPPLCARPATVMYDSSTSTLRSTTSGRRRDRRHRRARARRPFRRG